MGNNVNSMFNYARYSSEKFIAIFFIDHIFLTYQFVIITILSEPWSDLGTYSND